MLDNTAIFKFDSKSMKLINKLMVYTKSNSSSETIRKALYLLDIVVNESNQDKSVVIKSSDGTETKILI